MEALRKKNIPTTDIPFTMLWATETEIVEPLDGKYDESKQQWIGTKAMARDTKTSRTFSTGHLPPDSDTKIDD